MHHQCATASHAGQGSTRHLGCQRLIPAHPFGTPVRSAPFTSMWDLATDKRGCGVPDHSPCTPPPPRLRTLPSHPAAHLSTGTTLPPNRPNMSPATSAPPPTLADHGTIVLCMVPHHVERKPSPSQLLRHCIGREDGAGARGGQDAHRQLYCESVQHRALPHPRPRPRPLPSSVLLSGSGDWCGVGWGTQLSPSRRAPRRRRWGESATR